MTTKSDKPAPLPSLARPRFNYMFLHDIFAVTDCDRNSDRGNSQ